MGEGGGSVRERAGELSSIRAGDGRARPTTSICTNLNLLEDIYAIKPIVARPKPNKLGDFFFSLPVNTVSSYLKNFTLLI